MISEQFSSVIYEISKVCSSQRVSMFPRWNGLSHFSSGIMSMGFSDGSKFEDLSKVQLFSIFLLKWQLNTTHADFYLCSS